MGGGCGDILILLEEMIYMIREHGRSAMVSENVWEICYIFCVSVENMWEI